uniref:Phosphatidylinositol 3-kinase, catalytic subunit type 3 n=1 Tax=Nothobranchius furzeri TaxID=105023 RepID=A0A8C6NLL8_NOTFU
MQKLSKNLDLKLTPYKVLATSTKHGFMQFVQSVPVAEVLATEGNIQSFFRKHAPSEKGPYGVSSEVMDTYVKSCAGYCVITYILGVGDRHLDNLLLTKTGKINTLGKKPSFMLPEFVFSPPTRFPLPSSSREALPHRLWLHPRPRPQTSAPAHEAE